MHLSVHLSPPPLPLFCSPLLFIYFSFFPNIHSLFPLLTHWMPRARCHLEKCVIFCLTFQPFLQGPISVLSKWIRTRVFFFLPELSICIIIFDTADRGEFMENQRAGFSLSPLCSAPRLVYLDQYCCLLVISFPTSIIHLSTVLTKTP